MKPFDEGFSGWDKKDGKAIDFIRIVRWTFFIFHSSFCVENMDF